MLKNPIRIYQVHSENMPYLLFILLRKIGYKVRTKPVASLYDSTRGEYKRKCNFDVEITIVALDKLDYYKELILGS